MPEHIVIRDNAVDGSLTDTDIVNDYIFESTSYGNTYQANLYKSARIAFKYRSGSKSGTGNISINGVLEAEETSGVWSPVAYTFNEWQVGQHDRDDVIVMDPNMFWIDAGVPNGMFIGGVTVAQVSPQQIVLPETWRIRVVAKKAGTVTLTSLDLSIYGELYNPQ